MHTLHCKTLVVTLGLLIGLAGFTTLNSVAESSLAKAGKSHSPTATTENAIPIVGAISHIREPDGSSSTMLNIFVGEEFNGSLPEDIDTVTVIGPKGVLSIGKEDFHFLPRFRDFWVRIPGAPRTGTYTFMVISDNRRGSISDSQANLRNLPIPNRNTFTPAEGETIPLRSPLFSWKGESAEDPLYYRLDIMDMKDNYVFRSTYIKDMFSIRLPPDVLKAGQSYQWRVRVADGHNWVDLNNRSHTRWQTFTAGETNDENHYRYQTPPKLGDGWQTVSLEEAGIDRLKIGTLIENILKGNVEVKNVHSVLLIKKGKLLLEEYFYGTHRNHIHHLQSNTKSVISILMGIAIDKGFIKNVKQPILDFFPEITPANLDGEKRKITIEHLLMMAPGLQCRDSARYGWKGLYEMRESTDWVQYLLDLPMAETPGTHFEYCNGASFLLSAILQRATGKNALEFAKKHLFKHLGIDDLNWPANTQGITIGWAELQLMPRDMAKIGQMMLQGGRWQGKQVISKNWVNQSTQASIKARGYDYGYQWWRGKTIAKNQIIDALWAWGHGGQFIIVLPELDSVVVLTAKHLDNPGFSKRAFGMLTQHIIPAVIPHPSLEKNITSDWDDMDAYVGKYEFKNDKENLLVKVIRIEDKLFGKRNDDEETVELFPEKKGHFYGVSKDIGGFKLRFIKNRKGDRNQFIIHCAHQFAFMSIPFDKIK